MLRKAYKKSSRKKTRTKKDYINTGEIKKRARRSLNTYKISKIRKNYVIDTSAVINKVVPKLKRKGLKGKIIVPNAVMAELENLANKGKQEGFIGLEQVARLHNYKDIKVEFSGKRPGLHEIRFAKSGEIDSMIRETTSKKKAILITADLVQAKSCQAYNIGVIFFKTRKKPEKKQKKKIFHFLKR